MIDYQATYDPSDDKLRVRASQRLDDATYKRLKTSGFGWAPKQDLFYAVWTPVREDILTELAGEIEDEDTTLVERAEQRADRFQGYRERRANDADRAHKAVSAIADNIPFGQPILVGHHSERHARRDAEKIENGMRKAVKMWETSTYWASRAAGAIAHAERKEVPAVRARRIKKLETDLRRELKALKASTRWLKIWWEVDVDVDAHQARIRAIQMANVDKRVGSSVWDKLERNLMTGTEAKEIAVASHERAIEHAGRWIAHLEHRLTYERTLLAESNYVPPPKAKSKAELPLLNRSGLVAYRRRFHPGNIEEQQATPITKAEYAKVNKDYKGTVISADGTHRLRTCLINHAYCVVFLSDSKLHQAPAPEVVAAKAEEEEIERDIEMDTRLALMTKANAEREAQREVKAEADANEEPFRAMQVSLKNGVQVVTAEYLFPTPHEVVEMMVALANLCPGMSVLEPSAGTGNILRAIFRTERVTALAYEINPKLAAALEQVFADKRLRVRCADFLAEQPAHTYQRILMNPPFGNGLDIKHILHAQKFLAPGGRLVAICADGPRQQIALRPIATTWKELAEGSFATQGTWVRTALLTIDN